MFGAQLGTKFATHTIVIYHAAFGHFVPGFAKISYRNMNFFELLRAQKVKKVRVQSANVNTY